MAGLGPAIHDFAALEGKKIVDDRHKAGHDGRTRSVMTGEIIGYQPALPGAPLNGPVRLLVIQPP